MWPDLRLAARALGKNPGFTTVAVLTLALGIGANTAIFSVVYATLLRPLPFPDPERLVAIYSQFLALNLSRGGCSPAEYYDFRQQSHLFEDLAALWTNSYNMSGPGGGDDRPERLLGGEVTATLFPLLGLRPVIGRVFTEEEDQPGRNQVVVLEEGLWRRRFGADPKVIGRRVRLNGETFTVIGVIPPTLGSLSEVQLWRPIAFTAEQRSPQRRGNKFLLVMARLKKGVSLAEAQAGMDRVAAALGREFPTSYPATSGWGILVAPLGEMMVQDIRPALLLLMAAVGLLLLIAATNVANLMAARAVGRWREIAIRHALGAGRWRIARQLLAESLLLALYGGAAGLALGWWGLKALAQASPPNLRRLGEVDLDPAVFVFTFGVSLATGLLFGLGLAVQASRGNPCESLKEGARGSSGGRKRRLRSFLVVQEVALAMILLIGAGLLVQSFVRLQRVDPGFRPEGILSFRVSLPPARYADLAKMSAAWRGILDAVRNLPGVTSAGAVSVLPFSGSNFPAAFAIEGRDTPPGGTAPLGDVRIVSPGYFSAMGIPLRRGRLFAETDTAEAPGVALVDEKLAKQYWPNEDPVGKRVRRSVLQSLPWLTIVGVVGHVKHSQLDAESRGAIYYHYSQVPASNMTVTARTAGDPRGLSGAVQNAVAAVDRDLPVFDVKTMEQRLLDSLSPRRFAMRVLGLFSAVALALAAVGIYGVMAQSVSQRTHEIGIRMALGADEPGVLRLVVRQGMTLAAVGLAVGAAGAVILTRLMTRLLFGVEPTDLATFAAAALALGGAALAACYIPARRATRVDPVVALRHE
jgi:predicted permease